MQIQRPLAQFPQADNFLIQRGLFVAAWKVWFKRFSADPSQWETGVMPISACENKLAEQIVSGNRFSLDVICRLLVPWSFRNSPQATEDFVHINKHLIEAVEGYLHPDTGETVAAVKLTKESLGFWGRRTFVEQDQWMNFAEARIQADIETTSDDPVVIDDAGIDVIGADIYPPYVPDKDASDEEFIKALVYWVEEDPYQPMYQRQPVGEAVSSWHDMLSVFFWPKPRTGYAQFAFAAAPMLHYASELAATVIEGEPWSDLENEFAVKVATQIFDLIGLPQKGVTPENIRDVFEAAIHEDENSTAKMNSGWSYLAAFATACFESDADRLPQVGWSSRVSSTIITRLDFLLSEAGVTELGDRFPNIGIMPGWGGTRPREFELAWPSGYRSWSSHLAGSRLIKTIRDILNSEKDENGKLKYDVMPIVGGGRGSWTVRGVEMTLFGDGY